MYTKDNLPPKIALLMAAYQVDRELVNDRFLKVCNRSEQYGFDGLEIYEELCRLDYNNKDLRSPECQLMVMRYINS